jgi:hypothetical protein
MLYYSINGDHAQCALFCQWACQPEKEHGTMEAKTINSETKNLLGFASTRPSRTGQILSDPLALEARRVYEKAWFEQAGVSSETMKMYGAGLTGSPTGSKTRHELDDFVEDFGGGGPF